MVSIYSVFSVIRALPRSISAAIAIVFFIFCLPAPLHADGDLDPAFDADGKVTTDFSAGSDEGHGVAIQVDGKIVVAGSAFIGTSFDFAVARYNPDGSLDSSFDGDGKVTSDFLADNDFGQAIAIQADGKIVVVGFAHTGANDAFALARYNSDGSLDSSFDGDGKVTTEFATDQGAFHIAIQTDGKIVVSGRALTATSYDFALARYNSDGSLDSSFDGDGIVTTDFVGGFDGASQVAIQADGKIVAGGGATGSNIDFAIARYNSDGSLDSSFDGDGKVLTDFAAANDIGHAVAIQADGKIVVAGEAFIGTFDYFALTRYNLDGSLDNTFDGDGRVTTVQGGKAYTITLQQDAKIIAGGTAQPFVSDDFALVRLNPDGTIDSNFGAGGLVTTDFTGLNDYTDAIAIQADGKIVAAGSANTGTSNDIAVARYQGPSLWTAASPVPGGIIGYAFAQCADEPNSFYIISGLDGSFNITTNVWRYDAATDTWNALAPLPQFRGVARAVCHQGFIYVMGGIIGNVGTSTLFVYDIANNTWSTAAPLPRGVWGPAVGVFGGKIFMIGGAADDPPINSTTDEVDIYDIATNTWVGMGSPMPTATVRSGYVQSGSYVYVVGGYSFTNASPANSTVTQRYDMATDTWGIGPTFTSGRSFLAVSASTVALYAMGGDTNGGGPFEATNLAERLDLSAWPGGSWIDLGDPLPTARMTDAGFCTSVLGSGESWTTGAFFTPPDTITGTNEYRITGEGCANICGISVDPPTLPNGTIGVPYSETISANGGTAPYTFTVSAGTLPDGLSLDGNTGDITGTPTVEGTFNFTITATDLTSCTGSRAYSITIGLCLFCDEFDDGIVDPNWTYIKNISDWSENGTELNGTSIKKTQALAIPIFSAGCTICYAETIMRSAGGPFSKVWFLFHVQDKNNLVEVLMDESKDKWVAKQRINKTVVAKQKFLPPSIDPNTDYTVRIRYDGTSFIVSIDGIDRITLAPGGAVSGGSVGFKVKTTTATFQRIEVN